LKCEDCGDNIDLLKGYFSADDEGKWEFLCFDCAQRLYDLPTADFFSSPGATIVWMRQLYEKTWFDEKNFFDFMERLRTNL